MCNVIGYHPKDPAPDVADAFARLFREGSIRGLHAFGICSDGEACSITPTVFRSFDMEDVIPRFDPYTNVIAHARYCTSGDWQVLENNQPLVLGNVAALVFNGVIHMGTKEEMEQAFGVTLSTDNDGEVFLRLMERDEDPEEILTRLKGSFAGCWLDGDGCLWAGRNPRRPLWRAEAYGAIWYASTADIFLRAGFPPVYKPVTPGVELA